MKGKFLALVSLALLGFLASLWPRFLSLEEAGAADLERSVRSVGRFAFHQSLFYSEAEESLLVDEGLFRLLLSDGMGRLSRPGGLIAYEAEVLRGGREAQIEYAWSDSSGEKRVSQTLGIERKD